MVLYLCLLFFLWGAGVIAVHVDESDNRIKAVIELLILTVVALLLASPFIYIGYNEVQQQRLNKKDNEMNPFKVYERCIEQVTYFVVCDTRLPYPQCIKAYHKNWYEAQDQCSELNLNAKENKQSRKDKAND